MRLTGNFPKLQTGWKKKYAADPGRYEANKIFGNLANGLFSKYDFHDQVNISDWKNRYDVQFYSERSCPPMRPKLRSL